MTMNEFFSSLDEYRSGTPPDEEKDDSKPFIQVYTSGKNAGKRVKGVVISILLYPDNNSHIKALHTLYDLGYNFACILHDKDYIESETPVEGSAQIESTLSTINDVDMDDSELYDEIPISVIDTKLKKPHIHVVVSVQNGRTNTGFAKELKVPSRLVRIVNGLNVRLAYLCHRDNKDKYPYSVDRVAGPLSVRMPTVLKSVDGYLPSLALDLCKYIDSKTDSITWSDVLKYANKYGYNDVIYNSKSSYYQSIRQAYYDKKRELQELQKELQFSEKLKNLSETCATLLMNQRVLCEMLDLPIIQGSELQYNIVGERMLKNIALKRKEKKK